MNSYDKQCNTKLTRNSNRVRRALEEANRKVGESLVGIRLNTRSKALTNTLIYAQSGRENNDRYIKMYRKPKVEASFSFVIDGSASMGHSERVPAGTYWGECVSLLYALHKTVEKLQIASCSAVCHYQDVPFEELAPLSSTDCFPVLSIIKPLNGKWCDKLPNKLRKKKPSSGWTSLVSYAEGAIDMIKTSPARHRIAFFLTDGNSGDKKFLESIRLQALSKGIKLVGIGLGVSGYDLPNGIWGKNALEIAPKMMEHLEKIIKT
jgi:hypothetical protein